MEELGKKLEGSILDTNKLTDTFNTVKNSVSDTTVKATENIKNIISDYGSDKTIIIGLIAVVIVAFIVSYGLYYLISNNIFKNSRYIVDQTKLPIFANERAKIPIVYPLTNNGTRRSYTFWIYINDMNKYNGLYKHVLHIGDDNSSPKDSSPYIFLDKTENKMYVTFATKDSTISSLDIVNLSPTDRDTLLRHGITIPYIPLQRWVHVAIVINTASIGTNITCYVDGDYSVSASDGTNGTEQKDYKGLLIDKTGYLIVGGSPFDKAGNGFSGLISKFSTYNYDLNQKDIYNDYNEGPIDSLLARLGLGMYGVRSPVYKL